MADSHRVAAYASTIYYVVVWSTDGGKDAARGPSGPVRFRGTRSRDEPANRVANVTTIIIWNLADGTHTTLKGHNSNIRCLALALADGVDAAGTIHHHLERRGPQTAVSPRSRGTRTGC